MAQDVLRICELFNSLKEFTTFYGTRKFITLFTKQHHFILSFKLNPVSKYFSKTRFNPSLLWSKNLALLVLWGLRNPKLFFI
jgi:hypothetical protein